MHRNPFKNEGITVTQLQIVKLLVCVFKPPHDTAGRIEITERHIQLLASVSKRVLAKSRHSFMAVTSESRAKYPRLESKKDFQK